MVQPTLDILIAVETTVEASGWALRIDFARSISGKPSAIALQNTVGWRLSIWLLLTKFDRLHPSLLRLQQCENT